MGDTPQTKNRWAIIVDSVIHTIFTVGLTAGSEVLKSYLPFLRLPVISQIFNFIVNRYGKMIDEAIQTMATYAVINIQTAHEVSGFNTAKDALKLAQGGTDDLAKQKAREDFKKKLAALLHSDGSA